MKILPIQILQEIRELLSESYSWTKETCARDKSGKQVQANSDSACSWCLVGAMRKIAATHERSIFDPEFRVVIDYLLSTIYPPITIDDRCLSIWQDKKERRHEEVLSVLDRSIDKAKRGEKPNLPSPNRHRYYSSPIKNGTQQKFSNHKANDVSGNE